MNDPAAPDQGEKLNSLRVLVFVSDSADKSLVLWVLQNASIHVEIEDVAMKSDILSTLVQNEFDCIITQGSQSGERGKIVWDTLISTKLLIPVIFIRQKPDEPELPFEESYLSLVTHVINIKEFTDEILTTAVHKSKQVLQLIEQNTSKQQELDYLKHYSKVLSSQQSLGLFRLDKEGRIVHVSDENSFKLIAKNYITETKQKIWEITDIDYGLELIWKRFDKGDENVVQKRIELEGYDLELNLVPRMDGILFEGLDGYYTLTKKSNDLELDAALKQLKQDTVRQYEAKVIELEKKIDLLREQTREKEQKISTQQGSIDRYKSVLTAIPGYAFRVLEKKDGSLAISYVDAEFLDQLGWQIDEIEQLDFKLADSMDPRFIELLKNKITRSRQDNVQFSSVFPIKNKQGEWLNYKIKAIPAPQITGNTFWSGIAFPIESEEKESVVSHSVSKSAMEQIKSLVNDRDAALEQVRIKTEFLYSMSDEVRLPIERILNMLEAILISTENSGQEEYIDQALSAANNVISIINDIQDYAEMESERLEINNIGFNVRYLLKDVCSQFEVIAKEKSNKMVAMTSSKVPDSVMADPGRMRQILSYLINNAVLDTEHGEITIKLDFIEQNGKQSLYFQVEDNGREITPNDRRYLFHLFCVNSDERQIKRKSGLQLAVARQLAEIMGGEFGLRSKPDGACFWFQVPVEQSLHDVLQHHDRESNLLYKARIILLSKKQDSQLARWMYSWNVNLDIIDDGDRVLEKMLERSIVNLHYQILVVDCQSQNEIDYELIEIIKNDPELSQCKIILLAPSGIRGDSQKAQKMGVSGLLTKPVNYELFQAALDAVLNLPLGNKSLVTRYSLSDWQPSKIGHVLIVDAEENKLQALCGDLQNLGYTTDISMSGRDALIALEKNIYSILLIDCHLPDLDGFEVSREIRKREKANVERDRIRIIAMVNSGANQHSKCLVAGIDDSFEYTDLDSLTTILANSNKQNVLSN